MLFPTETFSSLLFSCSPLLEDWTFSIIDSSLIKRFSVLSTSLVSDTFVGAWWKNNAFKSCVDNNSKKSGQYSSVSCVPLSVMSLSWGAICCDTAFSFGPLLSPSSFFAFSIIAGDAFRHKLQTRLNRPEHLSYVATRKDIFSFLRLNITTKGLSSARLRSAFTFSLNGKFDSAERKLITRTSSNLVSKPRPTHTSFVLTTTDFSRRIFSASTPPRSEVESLGLVVAWGAITTPKAFIGGKATL